MTIGTSTASKPYYATVASPDGNPVKLRKSATRTCAPGRKERVYWLATPGARVRAEQVKGDWSLVTALCTDGYQRRAHLKSKLLQEYATV